MAINLVTKFAPKLLQDFTVNSFFAGKACEDYDLVGSRSLKIVTATTVPLNDYARDGLARFGTLQEVQDTVQELTMSQDRSFSLSLDKTNQSDQLSMKKAGEFMKAQMDEQVYPEMDKYALQSYVSKAGKTFTLDAKPTKANILQEIIKMRAQRVNAKAPMENNYLALPTEIYSLILDTDKFLYIDKVSGKALEKGVTGMLYGFKVVEMPDEYFPDGVFALAFNRKSVIAPKKIHTLRIITEDKDVDGSILQGHFYYDNFVLGRRAGAVMALMKTDKQAKAPGIAISANAATVTSDTAGAVIYYTLDNSDPRYSTSRKVYASSVTMSANQTIRAVATKDGLYASDVSSKTNS
uniref:Major capsid protein n=1 Tax=Myoviridae sp. ctWiL39 TaxID=2825120 RepID=A0A8S5PXN4_9CAUD|nr:MAG TPA: major capsid protein [Myoviridae sp. ctWiL39]